MATPSSDIANRFDTFIYEFFKENCGIIDLNTTPKVKERSKHKGLVRLRLKKQQCKKALKALRRKGFDDTSAPISAIKAEWAKLMKAHSKLRRAVHYKRAARAKKFARRQFIKDRVKYTKKLFSGQRKTGSPTFSKEEGEAYFSNLYRDADRGADFVPLDGMERPPPPDHAFETRPPTFKEFRKSAAGKRNGAAPGFNAITYLIFKKCPAVLGCLYKICAQVYKSKDVPKDWAAAYVVLLQKAESLADPEEFRPIAITNTAGKLFFSIIADRLQVFMIKNKFIKTTCQKGFLFGVPGCIEHSFALVEALRRVRADKRAIVISWIDLANAYGSVKHNLVQFALNWYHVPEHIQGLIFNYYEKLCASITTKDWSTAFFNFDIGLFQGCVLSTILFDCVFNLLLDFIAPFEERHAVKVEGETNAFVKAYADDLKIATSTPEGHQIVLNAADDWLNWTLTMRAKPKKCVCLAFRQFRKNAPPSKYSKVDESIYSVYDPQLTIAGKRMLFILQDSTFKGSHFKFLGRWMNPTLSEDEMKKNFLNKVDELMGIVNNDATDGYMKLWIYQHFVLGMLSWPLMIQDFNREFVKSEITRPCGVFLRRWAGVYASIDIGCFYRRKENFGLGLTSLVTYFEKLQIIKLHLVKFSPDPSVAALYELRRKREESQKKIWRPTRLLEKVCAISDFDLKFQHAKPGDKRGLGHGLFTQAKVPNQQHRLCCTTNVQRLADADLMAHARNLEMQGNWLKWEEGALPFDLSWNSLILGPGARIISFVLNATHNSVMTPDLRKICGLIDDATCRICCPVGLRGPRATLHHILAGCLKALSDHRYTWRHDSIILTLLQVIQPAILRHNAKPPPARRFPNISKSFVTAGAPAVKNKRKPIPRRSLLGTATDWKLLIDLRHSIYMFPPHIFATKERPDILLYSNAARTVIFGELTCPAEEGIKEASIFKQARYTPLSEEIRARNWTVHNLTIEVGARGFVARTTLKFLRKIGLSPLEAKLACQQLSEVAARCSYSIYLRHGEKEWNSSRTLLVPRACKDPIYKPDPSLRDN